MFFFKREDTSNTRSTGDGKHDFETCSDIIGLEKRDNYAMHGGPSTLSGCDCLPSRVQYTRRVVLGLLDQKVESYLAARS